VKVKIVCVHEYLYLVYQSVVLGKRGQ